MSFIGEVPIAEWTGPVGADIGPAAICFTPHVVQTRQRYESPRGCRSFSGRECWKRWRKTTFSGSLAYEYHYAYDDGEGDAYSSDYYVEEEWSGFLLIDDDGDVDETGSTFEIRKRFRSDEGEWSDWIVSENASCDAEPFAGADIVGSGSTLDTKYAREDTITTRTWTIPGGSGSGTYDSWSWSGTGSLVATRSEEDTEEAVSARSLVAPDSNYTSGYNARNYAARPSDNVEQNALRQWIGMQESLAPGQEWRVYFEVVRKKFGPAAIGGTGDYNSDGTPVQTRNWEHTITLTDEMTDPEDRLGSLAEADASWDAMGWAVGAATASANHTTRAWMRVVALRDDVLSVRLKKVQTGEADASVTVTTSPTADSLNATAPVWLSREDHTRTATISVEWVRDGGGVDVPAGEWVFQRKVRVGAWGRRQWDHAATVAGSRFYKKQEIEWSADASVTGATPAEGSCGDMLDLEQVATFEMVWSPITGWPARWTLLESSGSQGSTEWSTPDLLAGGSSDWVGPGAGGWKRVDEAGAEPTYEAATVGGVTPPTASGFGWTVTATVATYAAINPSGWGFSNQVRIMRSNTRNGEVVWRTLESAVTDETITVGGVDYRVFDLIFAAEEEGEMKSINVLWAEPVAP